jgi:toxin ParE1/3/4
MKYILDVKVSAKVGVLEAFDYYESLRTGLGDRFIDYWETQLDSIKENPLLYQKRYKDFRQILIKPYPYHIIYKIEDNVIAIYKVIYAGKHPRKRYTKK